MTITTSPKSLFDMLEIFASGSYDAKKMVQILASEDPELFFKIYEKSSARVCVKKYSNLVTLVKRDNSLVSSVKELRTITGCGLKESVDVVKHLKSYFSVENYDSLDVMNEYAYKLYSDILDEIE